MQRSVELAPELAIMLVDTEDDIEPLTRRLTNLVLQQGLGASHPTHLGIEAHPSYPSVYFGFNRVFVTNTRRGITQALQFSLQYYHAHAKGYPLVDTTRAQFA